MHKGVFHKEELGRIWPQVDTRKPWVLWLWYLKKLGHRDQGGVTAPGPTFQASLCLPLHASEILSSPLVYPGSILTALLQIYCYLPCLWFASLLVGGRGGWEGCCHSIAQLLSFPKGLSPLSLSSPSGSLIRHMLHLVSWFLTLLHFSFLFLISVSCSHVLNSLFETHAPI